MFWAGAGRQFIPNQVPGFGANKSRHSKKASENRRDSTTIDKPGALPTIEFPISANTGGVKWTDMFVASAPR